jgi:hypothetical protein
MLARSNVMAGRSASRLAARAMSVQRHLSSSSTAAALVSSTSLSRRSLPAAAAASAAWGRRGLSTDIKEGVPAWKTAIPRSSKVFDSPADAIAASGLKDGGSILVGGFGLCGVPMACIEAVQQSGLKNLTAVSDGCGTDTVSHTTAECATRGMGARCTQSQLTVR